MSGNFYDKSYYGKSKPGERIEEPCPAKIRETEFLKSLISPSSGEKLLDVGCGDGAFLSALEETGCDLWGIDISENITEIAKRRVKRAEQIICANAEVLPFADNEFDFVTAWGVIEHFPSIPSILKEIKRVAGKDAKIALMVPNTYYYKFVFDTLRKGSGPVKHQEPEALFSFREWERLIEEAGLMILKTYRHNKFNKPALRRARNILIPFYFSNHFIFICAKC